MSLKQSLSKAYHKFLQTNFNVFMPGRENLEKQRKYQHIELQKQFFDMENQRKVQRLTLIEYKKKIKKRLIEQQLSFVQNQKEIGLINSVKPSELDEFQQQLEIKKAEQYESHHKYAQDMLDKQLNQESTQVLITIENEEQKQNLEMQLSKINQELLQIAETKNELLSIDQQIETLEPDYILVSGMQKQLVLNQITYYEFQSRNLQGFILHPETKKTIEKVHYSINHNLPVKRELLYEVCPELFDAEIDQLDKIIKDKILSKRPRLDTNESSVIRVIEKYAKEGEKKEQLDVLEQIKADEYEMRDFIYRKCGEFSLKYSKLIADKKAQGFASAHLILNNIECKDPSKLSPEEASLKEELEGLRKLQEDFKEFCLLCKDKAIEEQKKLKIPEFVKQNKILEKAWIEKWELLVKDAYEFSDSVLLPEVEYEDKFDKILAEQKKHDIQELINQSNEEQKQILGGNEPLRFKDPNVKDENLISKLNILSEVIHELPEYQKNKGIPQFQGQLFNKNAPEERNILISEMPKILFLNNQNPKKFNVEYWATHFNIEPQKLRNVFNYISYAIPDAINDKETGKIFRFIYDN